MCQEVFKTLAHGMLLAWTVWGKNLMCGSLRGKRPQCPWPTRQFELKIISKDTMISLTFVFSFCKFMFSWKTNVNRYQNPSNPPVYPFSFEQLPQVEERMHCLPGYRRYCFLQHLLFPEGIIYNRELDHYRTSRINPFFAPIPQLAKVLSKNKRGDSVNFNKIPSLVVSPGIELFLYPTDCQYIIST